ncbi:MAG: NAD(P)H-dependent oxidoreductase [Clostridium sp.]|nr:NAD(P)H-dependent oxidoreductase [Clostridium sp.]
MKEMIPKLLEADIIIWSFPLYYFGMPSGMKAFMDRMLPMNLPFMSEREDGGSVHPPRYPQMTQVKHILISTCGFYSKQNNYKGLEK